MQIQINHTGQRNDYFTLTDNEGKEYQWHGRKGVKQDPEKVLFLIRKREYPGADYELLEDKSELQSIEKWIKNGAVNPEITEDYEVETSPAVYKFTDGKEDIPSLYADKRKTGRRKEKRPIEKDHRKAERRKGQEITQERVVEKRKRIIRPRKVIEKKPWVTTHPKRIAILADIEAARTIKDLKQIIKQIL